MILSFFDVLDRSINGPEVTKDSWDMDAVVLPIRDLVKKYHLTYDRTVAIPTDPDLADRIFAAALDLAVSTGVFSQSTGRVIQFTRAEIEAGLNHMRQSLGMGEGKDARVLTSRAIADPRPPLVWAGNPGVPCPEAFYQQMVMSWMQEPVVDLATCGSLVTVDAHPVRTGQPTEVFAVRRELRLLREGLRRVGRPGMGLLAAQSAVSEIGDLAAASPDYLRPCDAHLVAMFNELIIDQGNLIRAANSIEYGMRNASLATVMVGGLGGGPAGSAVLQAASFMLANYVCWADYHLLHPIHIRHVATSTREVMWVQSIVEQAFARNAPAIIVGDIYPKSGAGTPELLYEVAANAIAITVSGGHLEGVGSADGALPNGSGLEARWMGEVGHAVTRQRLGLEEANALILRLLERYENVFSHPGGNPGQPFNEVYDLSSLRPLPAWEKIYTDVKTDVSTLGLTIT
jgi:methylamine---corrinoid protein Co-methyltransferase